MGAWPVRGYLNLEQWDLSLSRCGVVEGVRLLFAFGVSFSFLTRFSSARACTRKGRVPAGLGGSRSPFLSLSSAPCVSAEGFLRVPRPGGRPLPSRSRPGARGASLWMRPRSPRREAAGGKRCLQGFTAARHPAPHFLLPRGRSVAAPERYHRYGREISARADGGEGLPGPVLHAHPAAGQPR